MMEYSVNENAWKCEYLITLRIFCRDKKDLRFLNTGILALFYEV